MKPTIYRYLLKEQLVPLGVCLFGLTSILISGRLLQLARYLFASSLTVLDLFFLVAFAMPKLILFALPMATLIGVLLAFLRLSSDNELIVLRASGIGFTQLLPPILSVVILTTVISLFNTIYLMPSANTAFENKLKTLGKASLPLILKEGTFIDIIPNLVFFFQNVNAPELSIEGIFVQDQRNPEARVAIVAERAQIMFQRDQNNITFKISNGIITRIPENYRDAQAISFKDYDLFLSLDEMIGSIKARNSKGKREMSLGELYAKIGDPSERLDRSYSLEFHQRLALPLSCFLLGLIGAPLGALFRQRNRMTGITLGLGVYLGYYLLLSAGKAFGENGLLPIVAACWIPNLATLVLGVYLLVKVQRETPFGPAFPWNRMGPLKDFPSTPAAGKEPSIRS
jgi:lipopolysaccharide export system permease protein